MSDLDKQLANLLSTEDHQAVYEEIRAIVLLIFPRFDFVHFERAWDDIVRLFQGKYPHFLHSDLKYHDLTHTVAVTLAVARLLHGAVVAGHSFTEKDVNMGLISGLMHDAGYIKREDDAEGTGAKYTLVHIERSISFLKDYYRDDPLFKNDLSTFQDILRCTGLNTNIAGMRFRSETAALLGKILGTADLLGQMAERHYLEKLLDLYNEFVEGGIRSFTSQLDLLEKTRDFYDMTRRRFTEELGGVYRFSLFHFRTRWGIDEDLYLKAIGNNIAYLDRILTRYGEGCRSHLRRKKYGPPSPEERIPRGPGGPSEER
ncbi:MAG: hypothetical protein QM278_05640 [Pseudomonadota bacterium]|nr:hypothetical protein [Pseudomonadota bacterium]